MDSTDLAHIVTSYLNQKGDNVSHKKLQKLLYYIQAWHLVNFNCPILDEDFQAWVHGPVLPKLYQKLKINGFNNINLINEEEELDLEVLDIIKKSFPNDQTIEFIYSVLNIYGSLNALELELLTHSEKPWIEARGNCLPHEKCTTIISKDSMQKFYTQLYSESEKEEK